MSALAVGVAAVNESARARTKRSFFIVSDLYWMFAKNVRQAQRSVSVARRAMLAKRFSAIRTLRYVVGKVRVHPAGLKTYRLKNYLEIPE